MKISTSTRSVILALIFCSTLALRITLAYQSPDFVDEYSYFYIQETQRFKDAGPLYFEADDRAVFYPPAFPYLIGTLSTFISIETIGKIILNAIAASSIILIYLITERITHHDGASLIAAALGGLTPSYLALTFGSLSPYSIAIPLLLILIYTYLLGHATLFALCATAFAFLHPSISIATLGILIYCAINTLEEIPLRPHERELATFLFCLTLWTQFLLYKRALLSYGFSAIWQNIPRALMDTYFSSLSIIDALVAVGTFPLALGMYTIIKYLHNIKNPHVNLIIAMGLASGIATYLRLITPAVGLSFIGITFTLLCAPALKYILTYIPQTKASRHQLTITTLLIITLIVFATIPSIAYASRTLTTSVVTEALPALIWLRYNLPADARIISTPQEGNLIRTIAHATPLIDTSFLRDPDAGLTYADIDTLYTTPIASVAITLMERHGATHAIFTPTTQRTFGISSPSWHTNACFAKTSIGTTTIYTRLCSIKPH
ncbi:hypothetical protein HY641_00620 [Candidatus Woesearchaeota archaeon]|nr:hypothetical protein [Candidatus Woesearchaeota archaeon]